MLYSNIPVNAPPPYFDNLVVVAFVPTYTLEIASPLEAQSYIKYFTKEE